MKRLGNALVESLSNISYDNEINMKEFDKMVFYMYIRNYLTENTYATIHRMCVYNYYAQTYFRDGTVKYVLRNEENDNEEDTLKTTDLVDFMLNILCKDSLLNRRCNYCESKELIRHLNRFRLQDWYYSYHIDGYSKISKKTVLYDNKIYYFKESEHTSELRMEEIGKIDSKWNMNKGKIIRRGLSADYYVVINENERKIYYKHGDAIPAYYSLNLDNNIEESYKGRLLDVNINGDLLFNKDHQLYMKHEDKVIKIDCYHDDLIYEMKEDYILVKPVHFSKKAYIPYHYSMLGKPNPCKIDELTKVFWDCYINACTTDYMFLADRKISSILKYETIETPPKELTIYELKKKINTLKCMDYINEKAINCSLDMLEYLEVHGVNEDEDCGMILWNLLNYGYLCTNKCISCFQSDFLDILKEIEGGIDKNIIEIFRENPKDVFEKYIIKKDEKNEDGFIKDGYIGSFDIKDNNKFIYNRTKIGNGIIRNDCVIQDLENDYQGKVFYDLINQCYCILWNQKNEHIIDRVLSVFNLQNQDTNFNTKLEPVLSPKEQNYIIEGYEEHIANQEYNDYSDSISEQDDCVPRKSSDDCDADTLCEILDEFYNTMIDENGDIDGGI